MNDVASFTNTAPSAGECFANAARILRTAEVETDSRLFEHYTDLSDKWMELACNIRETSTL